MKKKAHTFLSHIKDGVVSQKKRLFVIGSVVGVLVFVVVGAGAGYAIAYQGKIAPGVFVGELSVGGLTEEEAAMELSDRYQDLLEQELSVMLMKSGNDIDSASIALRADGATDPDLVQDFIYVNPQELAADAYARGRVGSFLNQAITRVEYLFSPSTVYPDWSMQEEKIIGVLEGIFAEHIEDGEPTRFILEGNVFVDANRGIPGMVMDEAQLFDDLRDDLKDFDLQSMHTVELQTAVNVVEVEDALTLLDDANAMLDRAPVTLLHTAQDTREYEFTISRDDLYGWIVPEIVKDGLLIGLDDTQVEAFLDEMAETVNVEPVDAVFQMEGERVIDFSGSQDGVALDRDEMFVRLFTYLKDEVTDDVQVATKTISPEITTASVNELGIREVIGVGISDFSGSPSNRVANIQHGAAKLDGLLIPPGEEISLVDELRPFTIADGYLPELVIKGDEIKPEVGGGLCQIGTTVFRGAMNSGLEITERRNHSLVVGYYNDPSNGNPGTDATLYEPKPDFRFKNDTEHHILLDTFVDLSTYELVFTFWGTSDGRNGYYTPPEILSWNGYGPTEYVETTDLAPGVTRCQAPHPGATAAFDYIVERPDGEVFEHTYTSVYRSLPRICLVGIDPDAPSEVDDGAGELDIDDVEVEE